MELVGELALSIETFRSLWARHDVRGLGGGTTTVSHPVVGELRPHRDKLPVDDLLLVLYYADQGSESDGKPRLLASMAAADRCEDTRRGSGSGRRPRGGRTDDPRGHPRRQRIDPPGRATVARSGRLAEESPTRIW